MSTTKILNNFVLDRDFSNDDAGFSKWTTGVGIDDHKHYFIKQFLDPKYPDDKSLSPELRKQRIDICMEYEAKRRKLYDTINQASDGNLIRIREFFRYGSYYYVATPAVSNNTLTIHEIAAQNERKKMVLCRTAAHSLMRLHQAGIVHSDIKESNILVSQSSSGLMIAKVIDFDCSFFESDPPENTDDLGGDQVYLAPETCKFICGDDIRLTTKMDVFALGLLFHQYMTGQLPEFNRSEYDYVYEALLEEDEIYISDDMPEDMRNLIEMMLITEPEDRMSMSAVYTALGYILGIENVVEETNIRAENITPTYEEPELERDISSGFEPAYRTETVAASTNSFFRRGSEMDL